MVEHGIDRSAFALLLELNNCSVKGQECVNYVLAGFLKKLQDSHKPRSIKVRNPSALLETTCRNMIDYLEEKNPVLDQSLAKHEEDGALLETMCRNMMRVLEDKNAASMTFM